MSGSDTKRVGTVFLVGAGPGEFGLIPLWSMTLIRMGVREGVIVVDRLAEPTLNHIRDFRRASGMEDPKEIICVGKSPGGRGWSQEDISALLIEKAREGKNVIRLKGGDPFVFGRGIEEAEACQAAGVPIRVFPGLSSATAAPTWAGIPLTLRGVAASFHVMTGKLGDTPGDEDTRWKNAARLDGTLVILMGVEAMARIFKGLLEGGKDPDTPVAVIERALLPNQWVTVSSVGALGEDVEGHEFHAPAVVVVGDVVSHRITPRRRSRPLLDKRVAITAAGENPMPLFGAIQRAGGEVVDATLLRYESCCDREETLGTWLRQARESDWLLFTSTRAVVYLSRALRQHHRDLREVGSGEILAFGEGTQRRLVDLQLRPHLLEGSSAAVAVGQCDRPLIGGRVAWFRSSEGQSGTAQAVRERGADVSEISVYRGQADEDGLARLHGGLRAREIDAVLWGSSRGVNVGLGGIDSEELPGLMEGVCNAALGGPTAAALGALGVGVDVRATKPDYRTLVTDVCRHFAHRESSE